MRAFPGVELPYDSLKLTERFWKAGRRGVKATECESRDETEQDPEYHETRETLWEVAGTTPKAKYCQ